MAGDRRIAIDPEIACGRPVIRGGGVSIPRYMRLSTETLRLELHFA